MYLAPFESPWYAFEPKRRWYAPWKWDVYVYEWTPTPALTTLRKLLTSNVRYNEARGLILMLGGINVDN